MESTKIVDIEELDSLLDDVIIDSQKEEVKKNILRKYVKIPHYKDNETLIDFLEQRTLTLGNEILGTETETFYTKKKDLSSPYCLDVSTSNTVSVPGVILDVQHNTMRTSSVIADAIMGQGQALDCFNIKAQDAIAVNEGIKNMESLQKLEIVASQETAQAQAEMYLKVFGDAIPSGLSTEQVQQFYQLAKVFKETGETTL